MRFVFKIILILSVFFMINNVSAFGKENVEKIINSLNGKEIISFKDFKQIDEINDDEIYAFELTGNSQNYPLSSFGLIDEIAQLRSELTNSNLKEADIVNNNYEFLQQRNVKTFFIKDKKGNSFLVLLLTEKSLIENNMALIIILIIIALVICLALYMNYKRSRNNSIGLSHQKTDSEVEMAKIILKQEKPEIERTTIIPKQEKEIYNAPYISIQDKTEIITVMNMPIVIDQRKFDIQPYTDTFMQANIVLESLVKKIDGKLRIMSNNIIEVRGMIFDKPSFGREFKKYIDFKDVHEINQSELKRKVIEFNVSRQTINSLQQGALSDFIREYAIKITLEYNEAIKGFYCIEKKTNEFNRIPIS